MGEPPPVLITRTIGDHVGRPSAACHMLLSTLSDLVLNFSRPDSSEEKHRFEARLIWVQFLAQMLAGCVTSARSVNLNLLYCKKGLEKELDAGGLSL